MYGSVCQLLFSLLFLIIKVCTIVKIQHNREVYKEKSEKLHLRPKHSQGVG